MSDGLTHPPTHTPTHAARPTDRRPAWVAVAVQVVVVVVVFAAVGAGAGWLWRQLWDAPSGLTAGGVWYTDETGLRASFSGVALFVVVAAGAGLVLGVLAAWLLHRSELATMAAVVAGSALAAYVMLRVGHHLSPPDPQVLAKTAEDGTRLRGDLRVDAWPPRGSFTFGALVGLAVVYAGSMGRTPEPGAPPLASYPPPAGPPVG